MPAKKPKIAKIRADLLKIHPRAQRQLSESYVKRLTRKFDITKIGVLTAVRQRGEIWIVDGQHRLVALLRLELGATTLDVEIHDLEPDDEITAHELFLGLNSRLTPGAWDRFLNELAAKRPDAVAIAKLCKKHGLRIAKDHEPDSIACTNALGIAWHADAGASLDIAMRILRAAWPLAAGTWEAPIVLGMTIAVKLNAGSFDEDVLVGKLSKSSGGPRSMLGLAKSMREMRRGRNIADCVADQIADTYNVGRRNEALKMRSPLDR